jgi:hypothetical protein
MHPFSTMRRLPDENQAELSGVELLIHSIGYEGVYTTAVEVKRDFDLSSPTFQDLSWRIIFFSQQAGSRSKLCMATGIGCSCDEGSTTGRLYIAGQTVFCTTPYIDLPDRRTVNLLHNLSKTNSVEVPQLANAPQMTL